MEWLLPVGSALWLGILTSISPCPLATNIAAISFIGKRLERPSLVFATGLLYTLGRTLVYLILAIILVASLLSVAELSQFLQRYMNKLLGPVLIITGMFLLELIQFGTSGRGVSQSFQKRAEGWGMGGAVIIGALFALSFCPVSAALFFGSLVPLAVRYESGMLLPILYGIGTALPVLVFAVLIATGARFLGKAFDMLSRIEWWARRITGAVFILVGIYYCLTYIFKVI